MPVVPGPDARAGGAARAIALALLVACLAAAPLAAQRSLPRPRIVAVSPTSPADFDWRLRTLGGDVVPLERFRGRVLFVNVWATWCPPCIAELSSIQALADSVRGAGVEFLLVSPEAAEPVARFVRRRGLRLPVYLEETHIPAGYGLRGLPTTFVIDRSGAIVLRHHGAADWDAPASRALLRELAR